jgi:hypothetical protein
MVRFAAGGFGSDKRQLLLKDGSLFGTRLAYGDQRGLPRSTISHTQAGGNDHARTETRPD